LLNYVDLEWEDDCLKFHHSKSQVRTASMNQVRRPIYKTSSQKWKRYEAELQPLTRMLGQQIDAFGDVRTGLAKAG